MKGWTLIELLLTISIIFVLMTILASAALKAKFNVRQAVCENYKRQLMVYHYMSEFEVNKSPSPHTIHRLMEVAVPLSNKCYSCHRTSILLNQLPIAE